MFNDPRWALVHFWDSLCYLSLAVCVIGIIAFIGLVIWQFPWFLLVFVVYLLGARGVRLLGVDKP